MPLLKEELAALAAHATPGLADGIVVINGGIAKQATAENVLKRPYLDVRDYGAVGDGVSNDAAAFQAAIDAAGAATGGVVFVPVATYRVNSTLTMPTHQVSVVGEEQARTLLQYHGTGAVFDITASGRVRLENMRLVNTGGTGTHGVIVGLAGATTGWKFELRRIDAFGFDTAGVHVANCEQSLFEDIYVDGEANTGIGILVNASRHSGGGSGINNEFVRCRAYGCTGNGWDVNNQNSARFSGCQSLSNAGTYQVLIRGTTNQCEFWGFDLEDASATTSGIFVSGSSHVVHVNAFNLVKGVEFSAATGCYLGPSRFSTVTTPLTVGGTCNDMLIFDGGNLGTVTDGAPSETHFVGLRTRSNRLEVSGTAGNGYVEFRDEQSSDPAAPSANRGRLFLKDNGAGKTQLVVRFPTGVNQVVATEP